MNKRAENVGASAPLQLAERPIPETPPKGLIIKVSDAGLCSSDLMIWRDKVKISDTIEVGMAQLAPGIFQYPMVLGHEICGEVFSLGSENVEGSPDLKKGDRVVVYPWRGCQECKHCKSGETTLCVTILHHTPGLCQDGGFQQYLRIPDRKFIATVPDGIPSDVACMLPCSGLTTYHALQKVQAAVEHACTATGTGTLLIIGMGGLGLWALNLAKLMLPPTTNIVGVDISEERLKAAKELGASKTVVWDPKGDEAEIMEKTKAACGGGLDGAIDLAGIGNTFERAFQLANKGAVLVGVGIGGGVLHLPVSMLPLKSVTITGVYAGSFQQLKDLIKLVDEKKIQPPPLIKYKLEQAPEAVQLLADRKIEGRAIIQPNAEQ